MSLKSRLPGQHCTRLPHAADEKGFECLLNKLAEAWSYTVAQCPAVVWHWPVISLYSHCGLITIDSGFDSALWLHVVSWSYWRMAQPIFLTACSQGASRTAPEASQIKQDAAALAAAEKLLLASGGAIPTEEGAGRNTIITCRRMLLELASIKVVYCASSRTD